MEVAYTCTYTSEQLIPNSAYTPRLNYGLNVH